MNPPPPSGKTLRDEFAMAAMIGILARSQGQAPSPERLAQMSYAAADAMLDERDISGEHEPSGS